MHNSLCYISEDGDTKFYFETCPPSLLDTHPISIYK